MRLETRNRIEDKRIEKIDEKRLAPERRGQGMRTEQFVADFYDGIPGLKTRLSTPEEDKGADEGGHQIVDVVVSFREGGYAFAAQVTGNAEKGVMNRKLTEMKDHPFVRLPDMKSNQLAIPKVLVFLDPIEVKKFFESGDITTQATSRLELTLKTIDDHIRSLTFDLSQTKNPLEQAAVRKLIGIFTEEKKKYIH